MKREAEFCGVREFWQENICFCSSKEVYHKLQKLYFWRSFNVEESKFQAFLPSILYSAGQGWSIY